MRCADSVLVLLFCSVSVIVSCSVSELCVAGCVGSVLVSCLMFLMLCHVCLSCAFCKIVIVLPSVSEQCVAGCADAVFVSCIMCLSCLSRALLAVQMLSFCHT